ncbi:hypothetical protein IAT40_005694 [Kwoniella sp. CBS 6097]
MSSPPPPPPNPGDDNSNSNNVNTQQSSSTTNQQPSVEEPAHTSAENRPQAQDSPPSITFEFTLPGLLDGTPSNPFPLELDMDSRQDTGASDPGSRSRRRQDTLNAQAGVPGPGTASDPRPQGEGGNEEAGHGALDLLWSFTIRPDPAGGLPSIGLHPPPGGQNPLGQLPFNIGAGGNGENDHADNAGNQTGGQGTGQGLPPPWLFPPFFNFFMPLRTEPQPNPEKAAELLRSLPSVTRVSLARVDRIVAAQEKDSPPDEKGWKCGICLEGLSSEDDVKGKGKAKEGVSEAKEGETNTIEVDKKEDEKEEPGTGVKALPCNHLFHGDCLEPWFLTKHTCPSCRLDLDPLQTLHTPPTRQNPLRPLATGAGAGSSRSRNAHPYARSNDTGNNNPNGGRASAAPAAPGLPAERPRTVTSPTPSPSPGIPTTTNNDSAGQGDNGQDHGPTITFFWSAPPGSAALPGFNPFRFPFPNAAAPRQESVSPMTVPPSEQQGQPSPRPASALQSSESVTSTTAQAGESSGLAAPSTPGPIFDAPTFASPLQMASRSSPAPADQQSQPESQTPAAAPAPVPNPSPIPTGPFGIAGASVSASADNNRLQPQRRPHITIIRTSSPGPPPAAGGPGAGPLPSQFPFLPLPHHILAGLGRNQNQNQNPNQNAPSPTPPPAPLPSATASATESASDTRPPAASRTPTIVTAGSAGTAEGNADSDQTTAATKPFVPESLENWILDRERALGWRCDAPDCYYYEPPLSEINEGGGDVQMGEVEQADDEAAEDGKEMMSVYAVNQPWDRSLATRNLTGGTTEDPPLDVPEIRIQDDGDETGDMSSGLGVSITPTTQSSAEQHTVVGRASPTQGEVGRNSLASLTCPHRYHRKCASRLARLTSPPSSSAIASASASATEDDGRLRIKCAKCQKDGWMTVGPTKNDPVSEMKVCREGVREREGEGEEEDEDYAPSEREVESLIAL